MPQAVSTFFSSVVTGHSSPDNISQRSQLLADSLGQDLVYAVSRGTIIPPKHILLPNVVKSLTGNAELVRALNRLGHGVSYTTMEENETQLALNKLAASPEACLPDCMKPNVFTTLSWDNIDRLEETLTGAGTSHRVNGIIVQPRVFGPEPFKELQSTEKSGRRSIDLQEELLPIYNAGKRQGPTILLQQVVSQTDDAANQAQAENLMWILTRLANQENQKITGWTGFNITVRNEHYVVQDNIGYLPTINAPATDLSTVSEILNRSMLIKEALHLDGIVLVMDQALYAKAAEIIWKNAPKFENVILRLGTFHTVMNFLSILGKRFQDAGMKDILIEAGILATGSVGSTMEGKQYNRGVRIHKCFYEALMRVAWKGFMPWLEEKYPDRIQRISEGLKSIEDLQDNLDQKAYTEALQDESIKYLLDNVVAYLAFLRTENGNMSAFWMSYIDMVGDILLGLIRACRAGVWELHITAIEHMIPWCFAYDKTNYARYLTAYAMDMSQLSTSHPEVHKQFLEGRFAVQLGAKNPFGRIPVDQTTEETVNKDTQTAGGTCRFSLNRSAVSRYYLTSEYRSAYLHIFRENLGFTDTHLNHPDLQSSRILKDEAAVTSVVDTIEEMVNPFARSQDSDIVNISNSTVAPQDVVNDLMKAEDIGSKAFATFKRERLTEGPSSKFYDRLPKQNLKTFSNILKSKKVKAKGREVILKTTADIFGTMLMMAQSRKLNMKAVLQHPLGPLPWSLVTPDGKPRKTTKSTLGRELKKKGPVVEELHEVKTACVIDGMAIVQKMNADSQTFGELASSILGVVIREAGVAARIDVVFDVYREASIKNAERKARGESSTVQYKAISSKQTVTQWKQFLLNSASKTALTDFLQKEWQLPHYTQMLSDRHLYVTSGEQCMKISRNGCIPEMDLASSQEEADTRMLLHVNHASNDGFENILLVSDDTDVLIVCLYFCRTINAKIIIKSGTKSRAEYVDVNAIASSLGESVCKSLPGLHAFTGCDTVSAFAGKGKITALKLLTNTPMWQDTFTALGSDWTMSTDLQTHLQAFTCQLYSTQTQTTNINVLRYNLFATKQGRVEPHQLPPCQDALNKHSQRSNYQACIWKKSLVSNDDIPSPDGHGWKIVESELCYDWMDIKPAPEDILDMISCSCRKACTLPNCSCMANGLKCTELCKLKDCANQPEDDAPDAISDEEADSGDVLEE